MWPNTSMAPAGAIRPPAPGLRDAAPVDWTWVVTTTLPVLTFIGGLWWNRVDGDRRAFEQTQRETHLALQDALLELFQAAVRYAATPAPAESDAVVPSARASALDEYQAAVHRVAALGSRLADPDVSTLAVEAAERVHQLSEMSRSTPDPRFNQVSGATVLAINEALDALGALVRQRPRVWR